MSDIAIHLLSDEDFLKFKNQFLDKDELAPEDLDAIRQLFYVNSRGRISIGSPDYCDEAHGHEYGCVRFYSREGAVVERLLIELREYRSMTKQVDESVSGFRDRLSD